MFNHFKKIFTDKLLIISFAVLLLVNLVGRMRITDIDWATIGTLFSLMVVIQLMNGLNILRVISDRLIKVVKNSRQFAQLMVVVAFIGAMGMTNDVAIISILPLYLFTANQYRLPILMPATLITIAANLGSVLTPFGNPQNLFLFSDYHFSGANFFVITTPIVLVSLILTLLLTLWIPKNALVINEKSVQLGGTIPLLVTSLLAVVVLAGVFNWLPIPLTVIAAIIVAWLIDRHQLWNVDYSLLLTFACFFLIAGILSRNEFINEHLAALMRNATGTYLTGIGVSQIISNVPAAVLLSNFTGNGAALLLGVNVGGLGTLVASLANLLALKQVSTFNKAATVKFIQLFTLLNVILLIILGFIGWLMLII
nr:SLC13 family permease [Lactobacillus sp. Sy-1]